MLSIVTTIIGFIKTALKNWKLLLIIYGVAMTLGVGYMFKKYTEQKEEAERYANNQTALLTDIETYKTESGKNAAKVQELEMTTSEFKQLYSEQAEALKELGVNVKRLQSYSTTVSTTNVEGNTVLRDTVIKTVIVDSTNTPKIKTEDAKVFEWHDNWNKISGTIKGKDVNCSYSGTDTLTLITNKVPKKFLFFKWGCKYIEVNIVHQNPSSNIIYNRTINFK